jgi:serine acetyltransferase
VRIGNDAWVGACAIILPGVSIGPASVVGAGSVVTKDVPEDTVFAGNPARCLRPAVNESRFETEIKFRRSLNRRNSEMVHAINSIDSIDAIETLDVIDKAEGGSAA